MLSFVMFNEISCLVMMVMAGYFCGKKNIISTTGSTQISSLVVKFLNPALILNGAFNAGAAVSIQNLGWVAFISSLMFIFLIVLAYVYNIVFRVDKERKGLFSLMLVFSNLGFIGIPIVQSVYGVSSIIYVSVFILIYSILLYTYGLTVIQHQAGVCTNGWKAQCRNFLNPGVLACILAVLFFAIRVKPPASIQSLLNYFSQGAIFLSLMMIGVSLSGFGFRNIFFDKHIWFFSIFKMLLIPMMVAAVMHAFDLNGVIYGILLIMLAMPVGNMPALLASEYGVDDAVCSRGVAMTTLMSMITLPVVSTMLLS